MNKETKFLYHEVNNETKEYMSCWDEHVSSLNVFLNKSLTNLSNLHNALIIGVGNGNDLPLDKIANQFDTLTLLDIDKETLIETQKKFSDLNKSKLILINKDITNTGDKYTKKYIKSLLQNKNYFEARKILDQISLDQNLFPDNLLENKFHLVISSTISTQLLIPYNLTTKFFNGLNKNDLIKRCNDLADKAAMQHVKQIYNLMDNDSLAIITSEQYVWSINEEAEDKTLSETIKNPTQMLDLNVQEYLEKNNIIIRGRITEEMLSDYIIVHKDEWIWQFNENRYYLVKGWLVKLKQ